MSVTAMIRAMRPHHWLKNGLVFVPILLNHDAFDPNALWLGLIAFVAFSLIASAIYLLNDIKDVEADRRHPTKCKRPLAAGEITAAQAYAAVPILLIAAFSLVLLVPKPQPFLLSLLAYLFLALAYLLGHAVPQDAAWLRGRVAAPFLLMGQHGLPVFCTGIFLAFLGRLALEQSDHGPMQAVVNLGGLLALVAVGAVGAWYRQRDQAEPARGGVARSSHLPSAAPSSTTPA